MSISAAYADAVAQDYIRRCRVADMFPREMRDDIERAALTSALTALGFPAAETESIVSRRGWSKTEEAAARAVDLLSREMR